MPDNAPPTNKADPRRFVGATRLPVLACRMILTSLPAPPPPLSREPILIKLREPAKLECRKSDLSEADHFSRLSRTRSANPYRHFSCDAKACHARESVPR